MMLEVLVMASSTKFEFYILSDSFKVRRDYLLMSTPRMLLIYTSAVSMIALSSIVMSCQSILFAGVNNVSIFGLRNKMETDFTAKKLLTLLGLK